MKKIFFLFVHLIVCVCCVFAAGNIETANQSLPPVPEDIPNEEVVETDVVTANMEKLEHLYRYVDANFIFEIDHDKIYQEVANALFKSLDDQYSYFVFKENEDDYVEDTLGKYGGIGLYFSKTYLEYQKEEDERTIYCVVSKPFKNTPCSRAGMMSGDLITAIDGQDVSNLEADDCAKLMKGDPGTDVVLTLKRGSEIFEITLTRDIIYIPTVEHYIIDDNIGYLAITEFIEDTWGKTIEALLEFEEKKCRKIIIDLRSNHGGDINVALEIANLFLTEGEIIAIKTRRFEEPQSINANENYLVNLNTKVAVMINNDSASSAEILSAALKYNNRATLIGTNTFGKGIMQTISKYGDGDNYTSLTTGEFTCMGHSIHKVGISPDIEVHALEFTEEEYANYQQVYNDNVLQDYVDAHPDFNIENINSFKLDAKYGEIREEVLRVLLANFYMSSLSADVEMPPMPEFDVELKTAVDYLNGVL